ncbi:MAG: hypothetical protein DRJ42_26370 [Deltaproteobacteria bacterium]|nr:MAG: hypothetical protein DRJ42_26370 [Deltaproteobacteria bacterium]
MLLVMRASLALIVMFLSAGCGLLLDPDPPATPVGDAAVTDGATGTGSCRANVDCGDCERCADRVCVSRVGDNCTRAGSCLERIVVCEEGVRRCAERGVSLAGTVCREAEDACDAPEICDGLVNDCPEDQAIAEGEPCPGGVCDAEGECESDCVDGDPCETGNGCEIGKWSCDPAVGRRCEVDGVRGADYECRESEGLCDPAETCNGTDGACPPDELQVSGHQCREAAPGRPCDLAESCDGSSPFCPDDGGTETPGTSCDGGRFCNAAGDCTVCTAGDPCGPADTCEVYEISCATGAPECLGTGAFRFAGTMCRPSTGFCDIPEVCDGFSYACPSDEFEAATTPCRPVAGLCDVQERCTGSTAACPPDSFLPAMGVCRGPASMCDVVETCTGSSAACPADGVAAAGRPCGGTAVRACDLQDSCDGSSPLCLPLYADSSTPCGPTPTACDERASCPGDGPDCPLNLPAVDGTDCGCGECMGGACTSAMPAFSAICAPTGAGSDYCCAASPEANAYCTTMSICAAAVAGP